jgi:hypothetical protein
MAIIGLFESVRDNGVKPEKDRIVRFGQYYFVFDESDRLISGPNFEIGDIKIGCRFE